MCRELQGFNDLRKGSYILYIRSTSSVSDGGGFIDAACSSRPAVSLLSSAERESVLPSSEDMFLLRDLRG